MMTRQITIRLHGALIMADLQIDKTEEGVVYNIKSSQHFAGQLPDGFQIKVNEENNEPVYDEQALSEEGLHIVQLIWNEIKTLPAQFKGGA
ncbi:hypothetical protein MKQ68_12880 [Chitinophaga horti]|uniref:Uncharacterized protein n=1 Tax=Chitinophaga horti TaxID=2920382 RepID=A0ABY6IUE4_9BACT|nr:hypothetical protein [Chitinophaga horti]UYQ90987.1 hypothetical protein MKQ68_12880 [Chitinophaga horti]